jgi:hypothetical protein
VFRVEMNDDHWAWDSQAMAPDLAADLELHLACGLPYDLMRFDKHVVLAFPDSGAKFLLRYPLTNEPFSTVEVP